MTTERILVVDDEEQILRFCSRTLSRQGYLLQTASTGQRARALLMAQPFDLLIVDIRLPDIDGITLLSEARELDPHLTAVVITGHATMARAIQALQAGARGFVLKPFGVHDLMQAVDDALRQRDLEQEHLRLNAQLPILKVGQALMAEGSIESMIESLLDTVARQMSAERATLTLLDEGSAELCVAAALNLPPDIDLTTRLPAKQSLIGQLLRRTDPLVLDALSHTELELPWRALALEPDDVVVHVPLWARQRSVGLLGLSRAQGAFSPADLDLLKIVGGQIATALDNGRLFQETHHLKEFNENLVQNMAEGIAVQDPDRVLTFVNPAGAAMLGYTPEELIGCPWLDVVPQDQHQIVHSAEQHRERGKGERYELVLQRRNGTRLPVLISACPLFEEGHDTGSLVVFGNLTEVKKLQNQLIRAEKLAALGRLATSLAHEINNPLQALRSGLGLLRSHAYEEEKRQEYLAIASREVERLIAITERMLNFHRPMGEQQESIDVHILLDEILALSDKKLQHSQVTVLRDTTNRPLLVKAVADQVKQVFLNILLNALDAMPGGGTLTIETGSIPQHHEAWISFADTGPGIGQEALHHIFEPFYTTKQRGSGLGLAVSYGIVERHGGRIEVESEPGRGSTFTVFLPGLDPRPGPGQ